VKVGNGQQATTQGMRINATYASISSMGKERGSLIN